MTERLFDADSYIKSFRARVLSCAEVGGRYECVLNRSAFFPEGGGQSSDTGRIGSASVVHVYEKYGVIYHVTDREVSLGDTECEIDFAERFRKMQNHTGEHILSGIVCRRHGFKNVGFHLSDEYVRVDFDGVLTGEDIRFAETAANRAVWDDRAVRAWYPDDVERLRLDYRSKGEIEGAVRLVSIDGIDLCACCAPHVKSTGEVGIIKIVDFMKYKGGTRLFMVCGSDALGLFQREHGMLGETAAALSLKREEVGGAALRMKHEIQALRRKVSEQSELFMMRELERFEGADKNVCFFFDGCGMQAARAFAGSAAKKCGELCAVFFRGEGEDVYKYVIASETVDLKAACAEINDAIGGRGGGSSAMIQGGCTADRETIERYFTRAAF